MVEVVFEQDQRGQDIGFCAQGHAGFAEDGEDIVCAAVSAILQTIVLGLEDALHMDIFLEMKDGDMQVRLPDKISDELLANAQLLFKTMRLGLESIAIDREEYLVIKNRRETTCLK